MIKAALLDAQNVYLGIVEVQKDQLTSRHLPQVSECDLEPGRYRWNGKYFELIESTKAEPEPGVPGLEEVVYLLATGDAKNARVAAWCEWYRKTIDAIAAGVTRKRG